MNAVFAHEKNVIKARLHLLNTETSKGEGIFWKSIIRIYDMPSGKAVKNRSKIMFATHPVRLGELMR